VDRTPRTTPTQNEITIDAHAHEIVRVERDQWGVRVLVGVLLIGVPAVAFADASLLLGFTTGARLELPQRSPRFMLGFGPDLLTSDGLSLALRGDVSHVLDGGISLTAGWVGSGILGDDGAPLGLALGPTAAWTAEGAWAIGGRARATLGLWYARAALELDVSALAPVSDGESPRFLVGLALRWVPWSAFRL